MNDLYHDPAHAVLGDLFTRHPAVFDLVKHAEFEDSQADIPGGAFAWPSEKMFPLHTPEHAALSYLYARHARDNGTKTASFQPVPDAVMRELEDALFAYGVDTTVFQPVEVKVAAYEPEQCVFPEKSLYPVRNAAEAKLAEEALVTQVRKLRPDTRLRAFSKLAELADKYEVELTPASYRWAGRVGTNRNSLAATLFERANLTKVAEAKAGFSKLAEGVRTSAQRVFSKQGQEKIAKAIAALDTAGGLTGRYDDSIPDPVLAVYNGEPKLASALRIGDREVDAIALQGLPMSFFKDALDPSIESEITSGGRLDTQKLGQVLATLPADMGTQFCRHLKNVGVRVV